MARRLVGIAFMNVGNDTVHQPVILTAFLVLAGRRVLRAQRLGTGRVWVKVVSS